MSQEYTIEIIKPGFFKRYYQFVVNEKVIAQLDYPKHYGRKAVAEIDGKKWRIALKGFWKRELELTAEQSPYSKQTVSFSWRNRVSVRGEDGREYSFRRQSVWKRTWIWEDERNRAVVEIKSNVWAGKRRGHAKLEQSAQPTLLWLMLIGWFVMVAAEDAAAAAA